MKTKLCPLVLLLVALAAGRASAAKPSQSRSASRPNIVYILADDMGIGDISCLYSNCAWKTPNLDRLAREGRTFTDAHSASGVCTPSRYTLLTGRYSWRGSLKSSVLNGYSPSLIETGRMTVASFLRQQGYSTMMVGKWHLGLDWVQTGPTPQSVDFDKRFAGGPLDHGFEAFFGISASLDMPPYVYLEGDRSTTVPTDRVDDSPKPRMWRAGVVGSDFRHEEVQPKFLQRSLDYLDARARSTDQKPFFLYLALASPHTPIIPTPEFKGKTGTNPYGDFVAQVDAAVGEILARLTRHGLATNTLVFFTADNGCSPAANLAELRTLHHDPSAGYRGHKADLFEGGHRVPFLTRWPAQIPAGTRCGQTIGQLDLLATCAELCGVPLPVNSAEDSVSILPLLKGGEKPLRNRKGLVHHSNNGSFAVREGRWKLLLVPDSGGWSEPKPGSVPGNLPRFQLYDLETDPAERNRLETRHPEIVTRLGRLLLASVRNGRSTPGPAQPYDAQAHWPQLSWSSAFEKARPRAQP